MSADALRAISEDISREHPVSRWVPEISELVLLEVDPRRIHAYWYVMPADLLAVRRTHDLPNAPLVLRLYDVTDCTLNERPDSPHASLTIMGLAGNTYFDELESGHLYVADLALLTRNGSMVPLIHSNPVHLPPERESEHYELVVVDTRREAYEEPTPSDVATEFMAPLPARRADFRRGRSSPGGEG